MSTRPERDLRDLFRRSFPPRRPVPLPVGLYRWRYELGVLAAVAALALLGARLGWVVPLCLVSGVAAGTLGRPGGFAYLRDGCWAVFVQHRLRTAFRESGVVNWSGRHPAIAWTTIRPDAVRVHLLCPAGLALAAVADVTDELAAACCAAGVTVEQHPDNAAHLVLTVVRRRAHAEPAG